ncbi:MAG: PmbA/TldA family metallopeptidase, partial [Terriglobia bacterium]
MKEWAENALDTALARGASHAEVRVMDTRQRYLSTKNGQAGQVRDSQSLGIGIRVIANGGWGFASTRDLTRGSVDAAAAKAVEIARASSLCKKHDIRLAPEGKVVARWEAACKVDPFTVPVSTCLSLMLAIDAE